MPNSATDLLIGLPPEQQAIHARCYHPSGLFMPLAHADLEQSVADRIEQIVKSYPDRVAVKTPARSLTYLELDHLANGVANGIPEHRDSEPTPVGVLCDNSHRLIAAMLGAWKAGRCAAIVDPAVPSARVAAALENSGADLVIADKHHLPLAIKTAGKRRLIVMDDVEHARARMPARRVADPGAYACIVYTSGSTGEPKAVILNHRNLLHQASLFIAAYRACVEDKVALLTSGTSNAIHNILFALVTGAALFPFDVRRNGVNRLAEWFATQQISIGMMSSPLFRSLCEACTMEHFPALRLLRLRSEAVYRSDFELYRKHVPQQCILNVGLASSETGLFRNGYFDHDSRVAGNEVPVGYPVADKEVWLEDPDGRRLGPNEIGEIVVRSRYLSPGYWLRPDLTATKFRADPEGGDKRVCLTGDLGMMMPDGCLVHKGRKDFRVKVRGYRVELAEVENALRSYPGVTEAVVVALKNKAGETRLAAYFTSRTEQRPAAKELRVFLEQKLPSFMSPSVIIPMDALPFTPSGKVDRKALPALDGSRPDLSSAYVAPGNATEERLAAIWEDVLGLDCVGVGDNFFELGGHSLAAARIISRVVKTFRLELSVDTLFQSPTVRDMTAVLLQNQASAATEEYLSQVLNDLDKLSDAEAERVLGAEAPEKH